MTCLLLEFVSLSARRWPGSSLVPFILVRPVSLRSNILCSLTLRSVLLGYRSCIYHPSSYGRIYNMKIRNCVSRSVIFWKIQSCDKKFFYPKRLVDLFDVGKVVPNKGEPIPYMGFIRRIYGRSSKTLDTRSFKLLE